MSKESKEFTISKRKKLYEYFSSNFEEENYDMVSKRKIIGKGGQGKVFLSCTNKNKCIAVKKYYLEEKESKYIEEPFTKKALKFGNYIEMAAMQLTNQLVLQKICPHFILNFGWRFKERVGACDDIYPYKALHYNEYIEDAKTYEEWCSKRRSYVEWVNVYFQLMVAIHTLQDRFKLTHLDLHGQNILVREVSKGGYWLYEIGSTKYYVPNLGFILYVSDFGHAWVPEYFASWFIRRRYRSKNVKHYFDVIKLFTSTKETTKAPNELRKEIRKKVKNTESLEQVIHDIYHSIYNQRPEKAKLIDKFKTRVYIEDSDIPEVLRPIVRN